MSDIKLLLLLRSAVLAKHPRGWIVGVTDLPLKDFVEACNESELLTAEIEDGDGLCVIRYIIPDEKRPGIIIIKKQDEAKLNTPVPFSETKIQRLERERDEARGERDEARRDLAAAEELHQRRFSTVKATLEEVHRERNEAIARCHQLKLALDEAREKLKFRYTLNQHADKSSVDDSTYVLTQPPCQRASRVMSDHVSAFTGGLRGATKRHAELYMAAHRISTIDALFHVIRYCRTPHSIGKMKRQKLLKEIEVYESTNHK